MFLCPLALQLREFQKLNRKELNVPGTSCSSDLYLPPIDLRGFAAGKKSIELPPLRSSARGSRRRPGSSWAGGAPAPPRGPGAPQRRGVPSGRPGRPGCREEGFFPVTFLLHIKDYCDHNACCVCWLLSFTQIDPKDICNFTLEIVLTFQCTVNFTGGSFLNIHTG